MLTDGATLVGDGQVFTQGNAPTNVSITTDPTLNTVHATFVLEDASERSVNYTFGSPTANGTGAFIEDRRFFAINGGATVSGSGVTSRHGIITGNAAVFANSAIPAGVTLCTCEHLAWGFWGAQRQQMMGITAVANTHLATWVAGNLASDLQVTSSTVMNASYSGHVIGNVRNGAGTIDRYVAIGGINLTFDFSPGSFDFTGVTVTNYDGVTYTSTPPGSTGFNSNAYSTTEAEMTVSGGGRTLRLQGAFFGGQGGGAIPLATGGQGTITGTDYHSSFTYAAQAP